MLDLTIVTRKLTQGQPPAEMEPRVQRQESTAPEAAASGPATPAASPAAKARIDPHAVAERVYELMRRDMAIARDRCGQRTP